MNGSRCTKWACSSFEGGELLWHDCTSGRDLMDGERVRGREIEVRYVRHTRLSRCWCAPAVRSCTGVSAPPHRPPSRRSNEDYDREGGPIARGFCVALHEAKMLGKCTWPHALTVVLLSSPLPTPITEQRDSHRTLVSD